jgi:hypothetical protein
MNPWPGGTLSMLKTRKSAIRWLDRRFPATIAAIQENENSERPRCSVRSASDTARVHVRRVRASLRIASATTKMCFLVYASVPGRDIASAVSLVL